MPGLGHMYAGEAKRGLIIFIVSLLAVPLALFLGLLPYQPLNVLSMALTFLAVYLFAIADSVRIARSRRYGYVLKRYNKWYLYCAIFLLSAIVINPVLQRSIKVFFVEAYKIPAVSMEPTLLVGDHIFVNKLAYRTSEPKRGDIVVFEFPPDPSKDFVKRVVGIAGDIVEVRSNILILNGKEKVEPYAKFDAGTKVTRRSFGPIRIPENALFMLGDNRDHSFDSRFWGCLERNKVKGKVANVYWSWDKGRLSIRWGRIGKRIE
jgi:signal peptidase I